jgi:hypothetical protein
MGNFTAPVETAFNVTDAMQYARALSGDLFDAEVEPGPLWDIATFWELLGNAVWVPRLMSIQRQHRLEKLIAATPLSVYRDPLAPRAESVSAITPGVTNGLRERVAAAVNEAVLDSNGQYSSISDIALWNEIEREAAVDFAFRSVRANFEIRGCASCGKWYEPQLSNRSRFCSTDCRKRFNNQKHSKRDDQRSFVCAWRGETVPIDHFSGLVHEDGDQPVTPLRIGHFKSYSDKMWCLDCVEKDQPLWSRYIAPLVEAREERERALRDLDDVIAGRVGVE